MVHLSKSILHIVSSLKTNHGGPSRSIVDLSDALADLGANELDITLLTQRISSDACLAPKNPKVNLNDLNATFPLSDKIGLPIHRALAHISTSELPDLIHSHGLWSPSNHWASSFARNKKYP